jgi:hypothetical protein
VRQLFARIAEDPRHRGVIQLYEKPIEQRDFAEWTMGFTPFATEALEYLEGYDRVLERDFDLSQISGAAAQKLIRVFKATVSEKSG